MTKLQIKFCVALGVFCALNTTVSKAAPTLYLEPGATSTVFRDINDSGKTVGSSSFDNVNGGTNEAFIFDGTTYQRLVRPAESEGMLAFGISNNNTVVGSYYVPTTGTDPETGEVIPTANYHGFVSTNGQTEVLDVPYATDTFLRGISPNGRFITGYSSGSYLSNIFIFDTQENTFNYLTSPNLRFNFAFDVDNYGRVIFSGYTQGRPGPSTPISSGIYDSLTKTYSILSVDSYAQTRARSLGDNGVIAGWLFEPDTGLTTGFIQSNSAVEIFKNPGFDTYIFGINNTGKFVGTLYSASADTSYGYIGSSAPVPLPASLVLLVTGLFLMTGIKLNNTIRGSSNSSQSLYC
jgi:hypothetical protein